MNDSQQRRPSFAQDFPSTPELDALVDAFARGNYARVRQEGARLASRTGDDRVKRAVQTLIDRTAPDRLSLALLALAGALLLALSAWWITHAKAPLTPQPKIEQVR